jgi:hypothetical protein
VIGNTKRFVSRTDGEQEGSGVRGRLISTGPLQSTGQLRSRTINDHDAKRNENGTDNGCEASW